MSDVLKTNPVSIPSVALAVMAANLACRRAYGEGNTARVWLSRGEGICPSPRGYCGPAGREYYQIIDRISRGEKP